MLDIQKAVYISRMQPDEFAGKYTPVKLSLQSVCKHIRCLQRLPPTLLIYYNYYFIYLFLQFGQ